MSHAPQQEVAQSVRSHGGVAASVFKALFLREALGRLFSSRAAWFWVMSEPLIHIAYVAVIAGAVQVRTIGGIDTMAWVAVGFLGFFLFHRPVMEGMDAVGENSAMYAYRQVKPVDGVIVRAALEGFLLVWLTFFVMAVGALGGKSVLPDDPIRLMAAYLGLWIFGLGVALMASVCKELIPETGKIIRFALRPMYLLSGLMFPLGLVPPEYREMLMLNPVAHGVEVARQGFAHYYHAVPETSLLYLYQAAVVALFAGLLLQRRFAQRLAAL